MKKIKVGDKLLKQKKRYYIILIMIMFGIILGSIYPFFLSHSSKEVLTSSIKGFFDSIKGNTYDTLSAIKSLAGNHILCSILIWILGISIIGFPVVILFLIYKGFLLGFSFFSIILVYQGKGILGGFLYVFPCLIFELIAYVLLGFYCISFSSKLFRYLFLKEKLVLSSYLMKYFKILCISLVILILSSLFEVYISPFFLNLFTKLL